ncbi:MAG: Yip1 family protein [Chloroflexota bacterium]
MINRVIRAAMLDGAFFKEAEADISLNQEALMVVILVSLAGSIGTFIGGVMGGEIGSALLGLIAALVTGVVTYYIWAYVTYFVGTKLFNAEVDPGELLRVLGYASGPRALSILSFIPCVGWIVAFAGGVWSLIAGFIGAREALDLDTTKTLITIVIGWIIIMIVTAVVMAVLGVGAAGAGALGSLLGGG